MELVPLLKKDYLEKNKKDAIYEKKIHLMHYVVTSLLRNKPEIQNKIVKYYNALEDILQQVPDFAKASTGTQDERKRIDRLYAQDKKINVRTIVLHAPIKKEQDNWLQKEELRRKVAQCSDRGPAIRRGAGWGACFGCTLGGSGAGGYYFGDGCVRCCCMETISFMPTSLMNKIMCYAVSTCTCAGCVIGACCVATGLSKNIDVYFA